MHKRKPPLCKGRGQGEMGDSGRRCVQEKGRGIAMIPRPSFDLGFCAVAHAFSLFYVNIPVSRVLFYAIIYLGHGLLRVSSCL